MSTPPLCAHVLEDSVEEDAEEGSKRVLEAIDDRLVTFSSDEGSAVRSRGAVPNYRLHHVVAAAVSRRAFIVVINNSSRFCVKGRGDSEHYKV